ncbi:M48 family metallopeptidase [Nakamurella sp. GG22]
MNEQYEVRYSERRSLRITVERDGRIVVRAPAGTARKDVDDLVRARQRWIRDKVGHPQKYPAQRHAPGKEMVAGESMLFLGEEYRVEVVESSSVGIEFDHKFIVPRRLVESAGHEFRKWYIAAARREMVPRAVGRAEQMGVEPGRISIVDLRYRWGSCSRSGAVRFNWRLIKAPMSVVDYVIVHEMAHLLEPSHSERFWSIVRSQIPRADRSRVWLKENGRLLEQDL